MNITLYRILYGLADAHLISKDNSVATSSFEDHRFVVELHLYEIVLESEHHAVFHAVPFPHEFHVHVIAPLHHPLHLVGTERGR